MILFWLVKVKEIMKEIKSGATFFLVLVLAGWFVDPINLLSTPS